MSDLEDLRSLKQRAEELAASQLEALDLFHLGGPTGSLPRLRDERVGVGGFSNFVADDETPRNGSVKESLASTARCLRSLQVCRDVKRGNADYGPALERVLARHEDQELDTYGLEHLNPFTLGQLLPVLRDVVDGAGPDSLKGLVSEGGEPLRHELSRDGVAIAVPQEGDEDRRFPAHGYLTYWALVGLSTWEELDVDAARPSLRWSETELYRQIALFVAGNDERSDAYQLGYNLLIQHRFNRFGLGTSLIDLSLRTLFAAQLERGVWEKRNPLFRYGDRGEAYCFSFEYLSSMLRQFRDEWEFLVPYESSLATAMGWAERNAVLEYGPPLWRSGHVVEENRPESWATAETYAFFQLYASYLTWRIETVVLEDFRGYPGEPPRAEAFDKLYQPEVRLPDSEEPVLLADLLKERLLEELRVPGEEPQYSLAHHPDRSQRPRAGILFGPPGTGKNTYVKAVAQYLGWPLVVLDPSDFAGEGLHLIATVAADVFSKLMDLEDAVIFFDEMESLMHRRGDGDASFEQQFLTTTFIPKLQELADRAACLFFVATNHYDTIDPAAKRPGRFDFRLQILPPAYDEKLRMAEKVLGDDFATVEPELRRESYRTPLALATRSEMTRLLQDLRNEPERAERLLSTFEPELAGDERIEQEAAYNSFDRRT